MSGPRDDGTVAGDKSRHPRRRPMAVRDLNNPSVLWVNFEDPTKVHPAVLEYAENLKRQQAMKIHPSTTPKEEN